MNPEVVFTKTDKGREELPTRKYHLQGRQRLARILVDGRANVSRLHEKAVGFDELEESLHWLLDHGFIRPADGASSTAEVGIPDTAIAPVKAQLIEAAETVLGTDAGRATRILREAPVTYEGLEQAVARCKKIVDLLIDEKKAAELKAFCLRILSRL